MSLSAKILEAFGRNKFRTKCKLALKLTKAWLEAKKKKRNAMQKYLKNDIALLMKSDLDTNAYGRWDHCTGSCHWQFSHPPPSYTPAMSVSFIDILQQPHALPDWRPFVSLALASNCIAVLDHWREESEELVLLMPEGLYVELNLSSCYDYVDECCVCISENLKVMQKQRLSSKRLPGWPKILWSHTKSNCYIIRLQKDTLDSVKHPLEDMLGIATNLLFTNSKGFPESSATYFMFPSECPEECKVAAASLMHAAARFADLPELRELRQLLAERYGNVFVHFVDKEFAKKLKLNPPIMEVKFQLMQEIAQEFSITWDSTSLEWKLRSATMTEEARFTEDIHNGILVLEFRKVHTLRKKFKQEKPLTDHQSFFHAKINLQNLGVQMAKLKDTGCAEVRMKKLKRKESRIMKINREDKQNDIKACSSSTPVRSRWEENGSNPLGSGVEVVNHKKPFPAPYIKLKFDRSSTGMGGQKAHTVPSFDYASSSQISQNAEELSSGTCEQNARQQQRTMQEDPSERKDDRENLMDEVLIHYSTKHLKRNSTKLPNSRHPEFQDQDKGKVKSKLPLHLGRRSLSRKPELMSSLQSKPRHVRAASFQSDRAFRHVHPKLPDYDELAERIEALSKLKM
ncbi:hypothetical protein Ancab_011954 [Ancistrocladus abbreviatus]